MYSIWNLNPKCHWESQSHKQAEIGQFSNKILNISTLITLVHSGNTAAKFHIFISMSYFFLTSVIRCFGGGRGNFRTTTEEALEPETAPTWLLNCCNLQKFKTKSSDTDTSHSPNPYGTEQGETKRE